VSLHSEFVLWCLLRFPHKNDARFVCKGLMSYLYFLCLLTHNCGQHILRCVFVLFVFVLCTLIAMLPLSLDCQLSISPSDENNGIVFFLYTIVDNLKDRLKDAIFIINFLILCTAIKIF
jgi:hypothetical protein